MEQSTYTQPTSGGTYAPPPPPPPPAGTNTGTGHAGNSTGHAGNSTGHAGNSNVKRLYRTDGPISGVAAGMAAYFNLDVSLIRLGLVAGTLLGGPVVPIGYVAAWLIIPQADQTPVAPIMAPTTTTAPAPAPAPAPGPVDTVEPVASAPVDTVEPISTDSSADAA